MNIRESSQPTAAPTPSFAELRRVPVFDKENNVRLYIELPCNFLLRETSQKRDVVIRNYYLHYLTLRGLWHAVSELVEWLQNLDSDEIQSLILSTGDAAYAWSLALLLEDRLSIQSKLVDNLRQRLRSTGLTVSEMLEKSAFYDSGSLTDWLQAAGEERGLYAAGAVKPDLVTRKVKAGKIAARRDFIDVALSILVYLLVIVSLPLALIASKWDPLNINGQDDSLLGSSLRYLSALSAAEALLMMLLRAIYPTPDFLPNSLKFRPRRDTIPDGKLQALAEGSRDSQWTKQEPLLKLRSTSELVQEWFDGDSGVSDQFKLANFIAACCGHQSPGELGKLGESDISPRALLNECLWLRLIVSILNGSRSHSEVLKNYKQTSFRAFKISTAGHSTHPLDPWVMAMSSYITDRDKEGPREKWAQAIWDWDRIAPEERSRVVSSDIGLSQEDNGRLTRACNYICQDTSLQRGVWAFDGAGSEVIVYPFGCYPEGAQAGNIEPNALSINKRNKLIFETDRWRIVKLRWLYVLLHALALTASTAVLANSEALFPGAGSGSRMAAVAEALGLVTAIILLTAYVDEIAWQDIRVFNSILTGVARASTIEEALELGIIRSHRGDANSKAVTLLEALMAKTNFRRVKGRFTCYSGLDADPGSVGCLRAPRMSIENILRYSAVPNISGDLVLANIRVRELTGNPGSPLHVTSPRKPGYVVWAFPPKREIALDVSVGQAGDNTVQSV